MKKLLKTKRIPILLVPFIASIFISIEGIARTEIPEYFGIYINQSGKLTELKANPNSSRVINNVTVGGGDLINTLSGVKLQNGKLEFIVYLNNANVGTTVPIQKVARVISKGKQYFKLTKDGSNMRVGQVKSPNAPSGMLRVVPSEPLSPGVWAVVVGGELYDFVIKDERYSDCLKRTVSLNQYPPVKYVPCGGASHSSKQGRSNKSTGEDNSKPKVRYVTDVRIYNSSLLPVELYIDDSEKAITINGATQYKVELEVGTSHSLEAEVGILFSKNKRTFRTKFIVEKVMRSITISAQGFSN